MVIFQPDRILLRQQIKKYSLYMKGVVLDVGSGGYKRYDDLFGCDKYITLDIDKKNKPDILASAENIPLGDNSIDSIISTQALEHIKNSEATIREFYRILKPGSYILATVPQQGELHEEPNDYYRFTNFGIKYLFENAGFEIMKIEQRGGFFAVIAQTKIRYIIDKFNLYQAKSTFLFAPFISLGGRLALFLDKIDKTPANRKHALGWCLLARKKQ